MLILPYLSLNIGREGYMWRREEDYCLGLYPQGVLAFFFNAFFELAF